MPKIYELLGYPINDNSPQVVESRKKAFCPFISDTCDGGGNRFMSEIDLQEHPELKACFPDLTRVPSGVCSIQMSNNTPPWVICPRRLLYAGRKANDDILRGETQTALLEKCDFPQGAKLGIWAETKVKYASTAEDEDNAAFDYTFDYIIMPLGRVTKAQAIADSGLEWSVLQKNLRDSGHAFTNIDGEIYVEDFPVGAPTVIEVMTSSTSGGNKRKRSCIPQAFEDCMLGKSHSAPGINYRQVWARMASQLIVKSQAAKSWGGKTIWVLQDLLADYISSSTALDLRKFVAEHTDEVNILAFSYGDNYKTPQDNKTVSFGHSILYAGPISSNGGENHQPSFQDIVLASVCPPRSVLIAALSKKPISNRIEL